jgi:hypothetical protein
MTYTECPDTVDYGYCTTYSPDDSYYRIQVQEGNSAAALLLVWIIILAVGWQACKD